MELPTHKGKVSKQGLVIAIINETGEKDRERLFLAARKRLELYPAYQRAGVVIRKGDVKNAIDCLAGKNLGRTTLVKTAAEAVSVGHTAPTQPSPKAPSSEASQSQPKVTKPVNKSTSVSSTSVSRSDLTMVELTAARDYLKHCGWSMVRARAALDAFAALTQGLSNES